MLLDGIETLLVLAKEGTMSKAGTRLYISQSAVSKRIANLEKRLGKKLIEPAGRHIQLTATAKQLIDSVEPSYREMKGLIFEQQDIQDTSLITIACSETLVAGYLSDILGAYIQKDPHLSVFTQQTPFIIESVSSGDATVGFCAGHLPPQHGIVARHLIDEQFTIVSATPLDSTPTMLLTNDLKNSANTYQAATLQKMGIQPMMEMDSYTAAAKLALGGVAPALIPMSVVKTLNIEAQHCHHFDFLNELTRPVHLCYRRKSYQSKRVEQLIETIADFVPAATLLP
ncbi:LysR family transcriptional regulator [Photobacterium sanguinicancri]|uniref:LysR family transcriptional regulator n=1 Tax=Photobacterium sanguinicancri TaxID=875932 RepID=UPI00248076AA|nr:LysR family transcriptional regulator [Photobacterium sanguinicancri]